MAIKVPRKIKRTPITESAQQTTAKAKTKPNTASTLPEDVYRDEIPPKEVVIDDSNKLVISVKRGGEFGLPHVDIRHYVTTERYTGFTKKGVNFPLELLFDLIGTLRDAADECDEKGLE